MPGEADTADIFIGKTHESNREFLGWIDEVHIWNRALSADEIFIEMNTSVTPVRPRGKLASTWASLKSEK